MEQNVLNTDLTGKVAVVTGASGTLCSIAGFITGICLPIDGGFSAYSGV
ncbi:MAG: hypothetical protein KHX18_06895 [Faecalibacterium prausnitzii]|nr:hypothetical protein [Faecalibacterium prausnitzii]